MVEKELVEPTLEALNCKLAGTGVASATAIKKNITLNMFEE